MLVALRPLRLASTQLQPAPPQQANMHARICRTHGSTRDQHTASDSRLWDVCFVQVAQMVGPLTPVRRAKLASHSLQRHSKPTLNACDMVSVEQGQSIAVALEVSRQLEGNYAYLQVCFLLSGACSQSQSKICAGLPARLACLSN